MGVDPIRGRGNASLVPLRGGCGSGGFESLSDSQFSQPLGLVGGGAVQISSPTAIQIDGTINLSGHDGEGDRYRQSAGVWVNGGGGGGLLLEGPSVTLGPTAVLNGRGGNGGGFCVAPTSSCTRAGAGATASSAAIPGGRGLGRVRINTPTGTYTKANTSVEDGAVRTGELATR